ncbi:MAG: putative porin [Elusimicrobia bacterium]|nr:putative porin [Elusimicrobiota bacterium]
MKKTLVSAALAAALVPSLSSNSSAQLDKLKLSDAIQTLTYSGDLRLRNDVRARRGGGLNNVGGISNASQQRYRLRFGMEAALPDNLTAAFRLASGTGEQVSTNQSAGKLGSQKSIFIDLVYLKWKPTLHDNATTAFVAGRMVNPLWRVYSSDVLWDDDFNPEGLGESVEWLFGDAGLSVFANGLQMVADQDSNSGKNQWEFSGQLGFEKTLPLESRLRMAGAIHKWSDEGRSSLNPSVIQDGNRRLANGALGNRFTVGEVTGQLSGWAGRLPVNLQATVVRNLVARGFSAPASFAGPVGRDAYQFGAIVGAAKVKGSWELAYFKKYAQVDATMADVADSDFGDGGTNRVGHIVWAAYAPRDWMQLKVKAFFTDTIDRQFAPGDKAVNRLQTDLAIKF